jgi:hypothetical protein
MTRKVTEGTIVNELEEKIKCTLHWQLADVLSITYVLFCGEVIAHLFSIESLMSSRMRSMLTP